MLTITESRDGGSVLLVLDGELDMQTHGDLSAALEKAMTGETILIDCGALRFCDAIGVHTFLRAQREASRTGLDLRLVSVNGLVHRVMHTCGALEILTGTPKDRPSVPRPPTLRRPG